MNTIKAIEAEDLPKIDSVRTIKGKDLINQSYSSYLIDESRLSGGYADYLFFPKNELELVAIVKYLHEIKIPFTVSGGRTGIVGSAVPTCGGAVIAMDEMKNLRGLGYDEEKKKWFVRVEPGMTLEELKTILRYKKFRPVHNLTAKKDLIEEFTTNGKSYFFPVDPTEQSATLGGAVAANASGSRTFKYGAMREWVKRLRIILPSGYILDIERGKYFANGYKFVIALPNEEIVVNVPTYKMPKGKNAAGYYAKENMDLIDLFIGSEGTLGIISEMELWIEEQPNILENILFFAEEEYSLDFVIKLRSQTKFQPEFIEFMDVNALQLLRENEKKYAGVVDLSKIPTDAKAAITFGFAYTDENLEDIFITLEEISEACSTSLDDGWCAESENEQEMFHRLRHAVPEIVNAIIAKRKSEYPEIHKLGTDMSVSDEHLKDIMHFYHKKLKESNLEYAIWGHIGNNHVHVNILPKNIEELHKGEELYKEFAIKAVEYGGSVSAEHGVGKIKKDFLKIMYGEQGIKEMTLVKKAIDPECLLNRGNIVSYPYIV